MVILLITKWYNLASLLLSSFFFLVEYYHNSNPLFSWDRFLLLAPIDFRLFVATYKWTSPVCCRKSAPIDIGQKRRYRDFVISVGPSGISCAAVIHKRPLFFFAAHPTLPLQNVFYYIPARCPLWDVCIVGVWKGCKMRHQSLKKNFSINGSLI